MKIEVNVTQDTATFTVNNRSIFSENIGEYQGTGTAPTMIVAGITSVAIRLGRLEDMFMIAAFQEKGDTICGKHLMCQLRDGHGIGISHLGSEGGRDLYGITFGRKGDLYNVYGIRDSDFNFVFDPSAPRTGKSRNANTIVPSSGPHIILDKGCH